MTKHDALTRLQINLPDSLHVSIDFGPFLAFWLSLSNKLTVYYSDDYIYGYDLI